MATFKSLRLPTLTSRALVVAVATTALCACSEWTAMLEGNPAAADQQALPSYGTDVLAGPAKGRLVDRSKGQNVTQQLNYAWQIEGFESGKYFRMVALAADDRSEALLACPDAYCTEHGVDLAIVFFEDEDVRVTRSSPDGSYVSGYPQNWGRIDKVTSNTVVGRVDVTVGLVSADVRFQAPYLRGFPE